MKEEATGRSERGRQRDGTKGARMRTGTVVCERGVEPGREKESTRRRETGRDDERVTERKRTRNKVVWVWEQRRKVAMR